MGSNISNNNIDHSTVTINRCMMQSTMMQSTMMQSPMMQSTMMPMQSDANSENYHWENYLTPAPASIAILGELVMISSATDFSLIKNRSEPPNSEYIKYPDSFRACLMQVCNSGWNAFNEAHKSMDRICLNSAAIPNYIKKSVQILFNTPDEMINKILPMELKNIQSIADECKNLAQDVEKKYLDVNMAAKEKELNDILGEMQNCNIKEIEFETTIKMIGKGLKPMGEIKEQWSQMVPFFQRISNIISISLHKTLKDFALTAEEAQELTESERFHLKELLYDQAFEATNIASMVNMISSTYTLISNRYLMDRISSLSRLMTLDPNTPAFASEREKLQSSCQEAQSGIQQLAMEKKEEYEKMSEERVSKIVGELQAVLPADASLQM